MGTPRSHTSQEPERPSISEKLNLLEEGKRIGKRILIYCEAPSEVFERVKEILLPLVPWLDKPLSPGKVRGMVVFEGRRFNIALARSGDWLIQLRTKERRWLAMRPDFFGDYMSRNELAEAFLEISLKSSENAKHLVEEMPFLRSIAIYNGILRILEECFERVARLLAEREERMRIMHERLALLKDFTETLDPLRASGKPISVPGYSIFERHSHGESRFTSSYLSENALKPFWDYLKSRKHDIGFAIGAYYLFRDDAHIDSLEGFLQRLSWIVEEIVKAKAKNETRLEEFIGMWRSVRLPFSDEEQKVLKGLADSIVQ